MTSFSSINAISPLDGRYQHLCQALQPIVSEYGLMRYRYVIEIKWLQALCTQINTLAPLTEENQLFLTQLIESFNDKDAKAIKAIEAKTNHDVKAVEYYIKEKLVENSAFLPVLEYVHFACTSEDINNLAYGLMMQDLRHQILLPQLTDLLNQLQLMAKNYAAIPMLSRTHGQAASPTTVGKEIANVAARLKRQVEMFKMQPILGKMNGAVGNYNAHLVAFPEVPWQQVTAQFVSALGLTFNPLTTQIEPHDAIAEYCHQLIRINTIFIDFCRDIWGYICLGYFKQRMIASETGSSTMPHKVNPIDFENAEGNFGIANALFTHFGEKLPISRWQRDLSDSTVLRSLGAACGYMLIAMKSLYKGLLKLDLNEHQLETDLNDNWEVLSEAIQTVLRCYPIEQPYEKLKALTRGQKITQARLHQFIDSLEIPIEIKEKLKNLTPSNYIGLAKELVNHNL
ncbi:MAG: adenylosuccinate lyase [Proteobacteria bacterium]|nr:adenylosuccinate lyase [Pseudomonadota bacterium]